MQLPNNFCPFVKLGDPIEIEKIQKLTVANCLDTGHTAKINLYY